MTTSVDKMIQGKKTVNDSEEENTNLNKWSGKASFKRWNLICNLTDNYLYI